MESTEEFRFTFSILWLLALMAVIAVGVCALQHPSETVVQICPYLLIVGGAITLFFAFKGSPTQQVFSVGALVGGISSFALSVGMPWPCQQYLCGSPFLRAQFGDSPWMLSQYVVVVYELIVAQAAICGATAIVIRCICPKRISIMWLVLKSVGFLVLAATCLVGGWFLVELRSNVAAMVCHELVNTLFFIAIVAAVFRRRRKRNSSRSRERVFVRLTRLRMNSSQVFWITVAVTIWGYLLFGPYVFSRPFLGLPGLRSYLQLYHPSIGSSWVTATCIFLMAFALFCGLTMQAVYFVIQRTQRAWRLNPAGAIFDARIFTVFISRDS